MIRVGQIYESVKAQPNGHRARIKVTSALERAGWVGVVTLTEDGREVRPRSVDVRRFHALGVTRNGTERRTGYVLVTDA